MVRKTTKQPVSANSADGNALLIRERSTENGQTDRKATVTQISTPTHCTIVERRQASRDAQHVEPRGGWATAAEDHDGFHFCQPRTESWGWGSGHRLTKTRHLKTAKMYTLINHRLKEFFEYCRRRCASLHGYDWPILWWLLSAW